MGLLAEPLLSPLKYPRKAFLEGVGLGGVGVFPAKLSLEFKLTAEWELWDYTSRKGDAPSLSRLLGPSEGCQEALLGCACTLRGALAVPLQVRVRGQLLSFPLPPGIDKCGPTVR